ncbi:hypothetical protein NQ317_017293 [Molorchus minor]|uniref:WH2 domain-containing protein n=1 Tax=Molorchus minor TaxID=1323400 RepID=A0ABQ9JUU0_9CUCU|nr:hypothetical protein NQ317_017293 [Molorchus minor]
MPAPPPPPPMAPAAPPQPVFNLSKSGPNDRGALLKSIQQGKKLKKTVTNDKSAPIIPGKVSSRTGNNNGSCSSETPPVLWEHCRTLKSLNNNNDVTPPVVTPTKNFSSIQLELKKQLAVIIEIGGPPPPAPNKTMSGDSPRQPFMAKDSISNGLHLSQLSLNTTSSTLHANSSTLHRKAKSNANLHTLEINNTEDIALAAPVISHGKPNLAPKPPTLNGKPAPPQKKVGKLISRAHSMRTPRSPSPQSPDGNPANKFGTVRHMSSILSQSLAHSAGHNQRVRTPLNTRPSAPPPSIPSQQSLSNLPSPVQSLGPLPPPPPPSKTNSVKHPNHAPPPPPAPSHAPPPPPPHKTQTVRQLPSVPANNISTPPPPPPRNSSMRDTPTARRTSTDLDEKYKNMFQAPEKFPQPPPYRNILKIYSYKQAVNFKPAV